MFEEWHLVESAQIRIFLQRRFTWNRSNRIDFFFFLQSRLYQVITKRDLNV